MLIQKAPGIQRGGPDCYNDPEGQEAAVILIAARPEMLSERTGIGAEGRKTNGHNGEQ